MGEYSPSESGYLHVLRHGFRPSEQLSLAISGLLKSGLRPGFLLHSTKEAYVNSWMYAHDKYDAHTREAKKAIQAAERRPFVIGAVAVSEVTKTQLRPSGALERQDHVSLAFIPEDRERFQALLADIDRFPDVFPRTEPTAHVLRLDMPRGAFLDDGDFENGGTLIKAAEVMQKTIREKIQSGLYSASVVGIMGAELQRPVEQLRPGWREKGAIEPVPL